MQLTFGMYLDGVPWSDNFASVGEVKLGPYGMLNLLETRAGLTGPTIHPAERINQYMQRLKACDSADKWFHASVEADSWSTAKQMLAWRDELIEAGWTGEAEKDSSVRLQALAELERTGLSLAMGRGDRLQQVLRHLQQVGSIAISGIQLHEPLELLPPVWQEVFSRLQSIGVVVEPAVEVANDSGTSNLDLIQSALSGDPGTYDISEDDDSLLLIEAADEWEAAENLAIWLAADKEANKDVTIICGADSDLLDQALQRVGLPQLGDSDSSRWRASLQVLPLVLANAWRPIDIYRLVEMLSLPLTPVPGFAAYHLLKAISKEPGVGGAAWDRALDNIATKYREREEKKGKAVTDEKEAAFVADLDAFLVSDRFDPDEGIPENKLKQRCQRVIDALAWRVEEDSTIGEAVSHAREMQKLAEGKGAIPRVAVERMLDSVIGVGSRAPDRGEQAAAWQVVNHPGQITQPRKTIIWWGFYDQATRPATYWSESEWASLDEAGIELEDSRTIRRREANAWRRGFGQAQEHMLMFYPQCMHGEAVYHHPFWDEIGTTALQADTDSKEEKIVDCLTRECARLQQDGSWQLAGRTSGLQKAAKPERAAITATHEIPKDVISPPESLSYSQMSSMIGCPMKWSLQYHARLKVPAVQSIPTGNTMIGTLCHRIIEILYSEPGTHWAADEAQARALELYDSLVPSMASELLIPGRELDNMRYREAIARAVKQLVEAILQKGLVVEKAEEELEGGFLEGIPFKSRADLLLRDKQGNEFVLDLKWSAYSKYRKEEVEDGSALQLATYAWLLRGSDTSKQVHAGYFMLAQGEILSDSDLLSEEVLVSPRSLDEIWELGSQSWSRRFQEMGSGRLEASGMLERLIQIEKDLSKDQLKVEMKKERLSQGLLYIPLQCAYCDYITLCGAGGEL